MEKEFHDRLAPDGPPTLTFPRYGLAIFFSAIRQLLPSVQTA